MTRHRFWTARRFSHPEPKTAQAYLAQVNRSLPFWSRLWRFVVDSFTHQPSTPKAK